MIPPWATLLSIPVALIMASAAHGGESKTDTSTQPVIGILMGGAEFSGQADVRKSIQDALLSQSGIQVVGAEAMSKRQASAENLGIKCAAHDHSCLVRFGSLAGLDLILIANAKGKILELNVLDVKTGNLLEAPTALLPTRPPNDPQKVGRLVASLFKGANSPAKVELRGVPPGANVQIDGNDLGRAPLPNSDHSLEPGNHEVTVQLDGHETWRKSVTLKEGEHLEVLVALNKVPPPVPTVVKSQKPVVEASKTEEGALASKEEVKEGPSFALWGTVGGVGIAALAGAIGVGTYADLAVFSNGQSTGAAKAGWNNGMVGVTAIGLAGGVLAVAASGILAREVLSD